MERRRSRSPKRSHRHRSSSSDRRHKHSHRSHKHHHHRKQPPRSPSPPRYKFDSPPKTYLAYNKKIWNEYASATNPEEFINKIQQVASTIPSSQANKIDRELYIGNLPSGITGPQLVDLLNRTLISIGSNICVRVM